MHRLGEPLDDRERFRPRDLELTHGLMSKSPTAHRTVRCSSMMPVYCTGISHPPNGTIFAPALRWTS